MAHESFEDRHVAKIINQGFIPIKVDREERPDIDAVYMEACHLMTGQGGWPLTLLLTPDQKPFYAATYLPKQSRYGMLGLIELLSAVSEMWKKDRARLINAGKKTADILQSYSQAHFGADPDKELFLNAYEQLKSGFDPTYGGFTPTPKFPVPHQLMFLLRYYAYQKDADALFMAEKTLEQMYRGGIFDHIGFGFSRYSTDEKWLVPHFEKMLYDNALLAMVYLEAYQITKRPLYKDVASKILEYVEREMTDPQGGFYSAQDADSEGEEGKYYLFTAAEVRSVLKGQDGDDFCKFFGITDQGNFEGKSIPNLIENNDFESQDRFDTLRKRLYSYRHARMHLHKDTKVLTSSNALMIAAFAKAYRVLGSEKYLDTAKRALTFILDRLSSPDGKLYISYSDGTVSGDGIADDYAYLCWALLELYEATYQTSYLQSALSYQKRLLEHFYDSAGGGFYLYSDDAEALIMRPKQTYDGATPSANSVMAYNLVKLSRLTGIEELRRVSSEQLRFIAGAAKEYPAGYCFAMMAIGAEIYSSTEIVGIVPEDKKKQLAAVMGQGFYPNTTLIIKDAAVAPFTKTYTEAFADEPTFYLCENRTCSPPFCGIDELKRKMKERQIHGIVMERNL